MGCFLAYPVSPVVIPKGGVTEGMRIPRAYRFPYNLLWSVLADVQKTGSLAVASKLHDLYISGMHRVNPKSPLYLEALRRLHSEGEARLEVVHQTFLRGYRITKWKDQETPFNFDVEVEFRKHRGYVYLIPLCYGPLSQVLDFLDEDQRLEEFSYDEDADDRDDQRGDIWRSLAWDQSLTHVICSWQTFPALSPYAQNQFRVSIQNWGRHVSKVSDLIRKASHHTD